MIRNEEGCIVSTTAELTLDLFRNERRKTDVRLATLFESIAGHFWSVAPELWASILPPSQVSATPFRTAVTDQEVGEVHVRGLLNDVPASDSVVVIIHGAGGSAYSRCSLAAAQAVVRAGHASLRL